MESRYLEVKIVFTGLQNDVNENARHTVIESRDNGALNIKKRTLRCRSALVTLVTLLLLSIVAVVVFLVYFGNRNRPGDDDDSEENATKNSTTGPENASLHQVFEIEFSFFLLLADSDLPIRTDLRIISRVEWFAQPPTSKLTDMVLPLGRVIISHTVTESCEFQVSIHAVSASLD